VLGSTPEWDPTAVKAFIGVSGAYDVFALADHLDRRRAPVQAQSVCPGTKIGVTIDGTE